MSDFPETRETLLQRVLDPADREAWGEFVGVYRPVIYRLARRRGLQDADAQDLAQKVLISVSDAIGEWECDESRGRFRTWLSKVTHNAVIDAFRRLRPDAARGGTSVVAKLNGHGTVDGIRDDELKLEYRRELFRRAAIAIRDDFESGTWQAFWRTTVDDCAVEDVARELGRSVGAVYSARARVMRRLREEVQTYGKIDDTV